MGKKCYRALCALMSVVLLVSFLSMAAFALVPSSPEIYRGIDVSEWQGSIDFARVKQSGIQVVYIRSSLGSDYTDPSFHRNYEGAKAQGLQVGFYHYVTARTVAQAKQEAHFFASTIAGTQPDCRLAMDFEYLDGLSIAQINEISLAFLQELGRLTGKELVLYSDAYNARAVFDRRLAEDYPLWVAQYGIETPEDNGKWSSWIGFQYSSTGRVAGIRGNVDLNRFTRDIFLQKASALPRPPRPAPEKHTKILLVTVRPGDTLWGIAQRYHTTVANLLRLNRLQNLNLIYAGETIRVRVPLREEPGVTITTYTVRRGDTLTFIARRFGTTVENIVAMNDLKNPNLIYAGEKLRLRVIRPAADQTYTVRRGDTLWAIARRFGTTVPVLVRLNRLKNPDRIYVGDMLRIP